MGLHDFYSNASNAPFNGLFTSENLLLQRVSPRTDFPKVLADMERVRPYIQFEFGVAGEVKFVVISVHLISRNPRAASEQLGFLVASIRQLISEGVETLIVGDFNINILGIQNFKVPGVSEKEARKWKILRTNQATHHQARARACWR